MANRIFSADRLKKRDLLIKEGLPPYADTFKRTHTAQAAQKEARDKAVRVAGRITSIRRMGKITFCNLEDASGKVQLVFKPEALDQKQLTLLQDAIDVSDFIGAAGTTFDTKRGEPSVLVSQLVLLSKALNGVPSDWYSISDVETRHRKRYLEIASNSKERAAFIKRSAIIRAIRDFYWRNDFMEVETPTLQTAATGAVAAPYLTKHHATDMDLTLRISHELPLKTLMVAGYERVFELGKAFRNEGIDPSHLPEHTHLEHYAAYWNFEDNMDFTEKMFAHVLKSEKIDSELTLEDGTKIQLKSPWPRRDFFELFEKETSLNLLKATDKELQSYAQTKKIPDAKKLSRGGLVDQIYKKVIRPKLIQPTFMCNYPADLQPLARAQDKEPRIAEQFQLVINGWEIVKAYNELIDPVLQEERFREQLKLKKSGQAEAMEIDESYIEAMSYGMPPMSGWGMGIDRFVALLLGKSNLRDVIFFPLVRPSKK
jgi:lysyl-tRNA synthetase class 2